MAADDTPKLIPTGDIRRVIELGISLQTEASQHDIHNVFDDGGYKELMLLRLFNLRKLDRVGDDAADADGRRYEIKTVARVAASGQRKGSLSVTTEHTLTKTNLARYRQTHLWIVAVFDQAHPEAIYEIAPAALESYFTTWEQKLDAQHVPQAEGGAPVHLNNPKIPLTFIIQHGLRVWPEADVELPPSVLHSLELSEQLDEV